MQLCSQNQLDRLDKKKLYPAGNDNIKHKI